jgi:hypothetical protein
MVKLPKDIAEALLHNKVGTSINPSEVSGFVRLALDLA